MSQIEAPDHTNKKWGHLRKILERSGPFDTENFSPSPDILEFLMNDCKILVIGEENKNKI
jgi:NEDD8-activating enzyme E1